MHFEIRIACIFFWRYYFKLLWMDWKCSLNQWKKKKNKNKTQTKVNGYLFGKKNVLILVKFSFIAFHLVVHDWCGNQTILVFYLFSRQRISRMHILLSILHDNNWMNTRNDFRFSSVHRLKFTLQTLELPIHPVIIVGDTCRVPYFWSNLQR